MEKKPPLLVLTGPTSVGKTGLSIALAKKVGGEIISADSMQVYRHMDIGSAKIRPEEMQGVPHYMIDLLEPGEPFNITMFQQYAKTYIREIHQRGHIPILVGGTGFYIQSVLYDIDFTQAQEDVAYRAKLEEMWDEGGAEQMHRLLRQIDPVSADTIHANNRKRVIRALEYYHLTGQKISEHNAIQRSRESIYNACYFVLNDHRQRIYASIDRRVDQMLADGLVEEVKALARMGCNREMVSMQGLGYQEILAYLEGEITLERAVYLIKRDTRHFAKRQLTWFRRERDVIWLEKERFCYREENILDYIQQKMQEKKIGAD
jgi:tRNA dimethylallyltransferase